MWELDLVNLYPPLMKSILLAITLLIIINFDSIIKPFKTIKRRTWILLLIIFLCGLYIRLFVIPHTHYIYTDDYDHEILSENILHNNKFCECEFGSIQHCESCFLIPWPAGYHSVLSLVLGVFGDSEAVAFNTNAVIGSLSIILIFLLLFLTFQDSALALMGAFVFNFIPVHLKYSGAIGLEIFSLFSLILTMIFLEIYLKTRKYPTFLLFLATLLYALNSRPENFLLLLPLSFYIWSNEKRELRKFLRWEYLAAILVFFILLIPLFQLLQYGTAVEPEWNDPLQTKLNYLQKHLVYNITFFFDNNYNSPLFSLICILGAIQLYFTDNKKFVVYSSFLLLFLLMYSSFRSGGINNPYPEPVRYDIMLYLALTIFFVAGTLSIIKNLQFNKEFLIVIISLAYLITLSNTQNSIFLENQWGVDYRFILSMNDRLPPDVYVLSYGQYSIMAATHKNSVSPDKFIQNWDAIEPKNNLILFKNYLWYEKSNESSRIEEELKKYYNFTLIAESPEGYAFYNLTLK
ncbi:glycosyltransferase family 39 protein [Candidatus Micrarchaeota archaeon]|nr:glycosyltransferase family 39 protein [Candidatus Micrarchaeota archaeon]